jgi:hypothetical protein
MKQVISIANVAAQSGKAIMADNFAAEQLRTKVAQYYGPAVMCALFFSEASAGEEPGGSEFKSDALSPWVSGEDTSDTPGEAEQLVMAALLVLLHEGGGHKVAFMLPELLELLGWPVTEPSWDAVERALDFYMRPVRREYCVSPPPADSGQEVHVTSWRKVIAGYEYHEEFEIGTPEATALAGRQVAVTFNPDLLRGTKAAD